MARIFQDGFESGFPPQDHGTSLLGSYHGSLWQFFQSSTGAGRSVGTRPHANGGLFSLRFRFTLTGWGRVTRNLGENLTEHYGRVYIYVDQLRSGRDVPVVHFQDENRNVIASIRMRTDDHTVSFHTDNDSDSEADERTPSGAWLPGEWVRLEWHLEVGESGQFELRINGNNRIQFTGDTRGEGETGVRHFCLGNSHTSRMDDSTFYIDDVAINDTEGTVNNSWPGGGKILALQVTGQGTYDDFISSVEEFVPWEAIRTIPHQGDYRYILSDTVGDKHSFEITGPEAGLMRTNVGQEAENYDASRSSTTAHLAFNENQDNGWETHDGEWVELDFGEGNTRTVTSIVIGHRIQMRIDYFELRGSNDGESWDVLIENGMENFDNPVLVRFVVPNPAPYRYYRLYVEGSTHDDVRDVRLYEDEELDEEAVLKAVSILASARWESYNSGMKLLARLGEDEHWTDYIETPANYRFIQLMFNQNPFTESEWSKDALEDLEVGISHEEFEEL